MGSYLVLARMAVGADLLVGEEVRGGDLLDLPPVLAVGGEGGVRGAVEEDFGDGGVGPGREDVVVRAQHGLRGARRRDDERRDGAEAEEHEAVAAMLGGEVAEGDVREGADEVQVAYERELRRRRRETAAMITAIVRRSSCQVVAA